MYGSGGWPPYQRPDAIERSSGFSAAAVISIDPSPSISTGSGG
jgi:hypothetical protein